MSTPARDNEAPLARGEPTAPELPETLSYRIKNVLLGRPLVTEELATERLGSFMAMGVLSPDAISSSAYGTEEMLVELVKYVGVAAFTLVLPGHFRPAGRAVLRHDVLPGSRDGLYEGRRLLCGGQGQLRPDCGPGRRRGLAH